MLSALSLLVLATAPARAQSPQASASGREWNSPRALELVARARALRQQRDVDSSLLAYAAEARGHVYFLIDRPGEEERTLVKADQIALEVFWKAPDFTRQRIVGQRDREVLPTNIQYHLDHLTVVQDEFEDRIRLGDGDEVSAVVHPVAPGAAGFYDYRLADSLTLLFAGARPDVRVYEILVRPRDASRPGFVGSIYLDRASAAIVRMSFTFTPSSYVDPYLDYIRISLDNSLWEGRHWLPYRQEIELRRELPQLDFLAGSIIRGRFDIGSYVFNPDLPDGFFAGGPVSIVPEAQREAFAFERPLLPEGEEPFAPPPTLEDVRAAARAAVGSRLLSGLGRLRLYAPSASDVIRYDRAEGVFVGLGFGWRPGPDVQIRVNGGWAFARDEPSLALHLTHGAGRGTGVRLSVNELRDLGPFPGASGAVNTFASLLAGEDFLDPYFSHGVALHHTLEMASSSLRVALRLERHEAATNVVDGAGSDLRPVRPIETGDLAAALATARAELSDGVTLEVSGTLGRFHPREPFGERESEQGRTWARALAGASWSGAAPSRPFDLRASLHAGIVNAAAPVQALFLLGGRETLLGHPYRGFVGDRFWLARATADRPVFEPWLTLRLFAAAGQTVLSSHPLDARAWGADGGAGVKASIGAGVGLAWDIVHVDVGRGVGGGGSWAVAASISHRFRGWL